MRVYGLRTLVTTVRYVHDGYVWLVAWLDGTSLFLFEGVWQFRTPYAYTAVHGPSETFQAQVRPFIPVESQGRRKNRLL